MENCSNDVEWVIAHNADMYFFHPVTNVVCSWVGYALFALMVYACIKKRVYWKRAHDVFLILFFALIADVFEMRLNFFFVFGMFDDHWDHKKHAPTTIGACTLGVWIFYFHFLNTYVEAIVSIYRFITRTFARKMSISHMYIGLGIVFALQFSLFFETFFHGTPQTVINERVAWPVFCTKAYMLHEPAVISQIATAVTMSIAPILSVIMMLKRSKRSQEKESGVTAFNLISSFSMMILVYFYLWSMFGDAGKYIPRKYEDLINYIMMVTIEIQYFRFPLLCLSAVVMVKDIRDAVIPFILRTEPKPLIPQTITNENFDDLD